MQEQKYLNYPFSFNKTGKEKKQKHGRKPGRFKTINYIEVMYNAVNKHTDQYPSDGVIGS